MTIYFVTSNENKIREAESILGKKLKRANLDVPEVQSLDVEEVVTQKAKAAYKKVRHPVLVEDTGFYIHSLNNFPGALIKWLLKTIGNNGICDLLKNKKNRAVTVKTCYCLYDGKKARVFCGEKTGEIPNTPRGSTGFGWDPLFIPDNYKKSFAEMSSDEKNSISMRKIALEKVRGFLIRSAKRER